MTLMHHKTLRVRTAPAGPELYFDPSTGYYKGQQDVFLVVFSRVTVCVLPMGTFAHELTLYVAWDGAGG